MRKILLLFVLPSLVFLSCGKNTSHSQEPHHKSSHSHDANAHMNRMSFEDLVKSFESEEREAWQQPDKVIDLLGDIEGKSIMDIGAGTGYFAFRLADRGARVIAADVDERFQAYIQEQKVQRNDTLVSLRLLPYESPSLEVEEVDHVIIVNTYHHIHNRVDYFQQVLDGLKPGGSLMVVDYKKENSAQGPPLEHRISHGKIQQELEEVGFPHIQVDEERLVYQYILTAHKSTETP